MNRSRRAWLSVMLPLLAMPLLAREPAHSEKLQRVDAKYVCFINKQRFAKEQIPVKVEGRTYYGCCDMCKAKLSQDPASRYDIDPVSGKKVDKASAVIGADSNDKVYFFENEQNLKKFQAPPQDQ